MSASMKDLPERRPHISHAPRGAGRRIGAASALAIDRSISGVIGRLKSAAGGPPCRPWAGSRNQRANNLWS